MIGAVQMTAWSGSGMVMDQAMHRPGGPPAVLTAGLTKRFGDRIVVDDVALTIPSGSVCGFVGPNGAGKTATIRMLGRLPQAAVYPGP